ncbi:Putative ABC transporter ATP-binding protein exp8 [Streptococcus dysgalactiae subsp. equisimilis AC-2713]|uniref:ABC transporter ATP-binding protein exp8 n=1 Tax=Streptococcus dysgalactiae subsp. equisimilis AC-2713 TaxID=759913 RepID=A0AB33R9F6_STREQ|nr:ABC transporter ATP-binding protein [Streptococcus dysgalactiae]QJD62282.1 ABC transporter ATP-binding protein [Streptococcus dysgalactiae subsp. equisimilis]QJD64223.1 ABC transporter ATP-binding protein [Streptococcus dysgalactiae subsp. equisimilis]QJR39628.1 ABC transporter ATP-binding protein [Streptococcus dysgalactiae subsp. equisimilis]CCI63123.1 Putative ABC transporter ATP-binding protein exp8 [Streptococcus dysgalactiae subsp. equisimilis AC-2713]
MRTNNQWQVFKRLLSYLKPYKWLTLFALALLLLTTVIKSIIPLIASRFIDHYLTALNQPAFLLLLGYYGMYLIQSVVQYLGNLFFARVSYSIVRDIRRDAFAKMQVLGMAYFDKTPAGSIVSRITNDTEAISDMFSGILSSFISAIFIFSVTLYTMLLLDVTLTSLVVIFLPFIVILVNLYRKKSVQVIDKTRSLLSDINSKLAESIEGIRIIQAFGQEDRLKDEFEVINQEHVRYANKSVALDSIFLRPAMSLLKLLAYAVLMAYFGFKGLNGAITAGMMYAFIQYINRLFDPLIEVTQNFSTLQTSMVSAGRVFKLIDEESFEPQQANQPIKVTEGNISFKNVSFSYDGKQKVLDNISFEVKKGETIAFVGATGSGKSSIINVFMRFYDFQSGHILLDGYDIRDYSQEELRQSIGLVLQDPFLYHGTIASNIRMYQSLSDEEVKAAAAFVDADQFIQKLPDQYQSPVSERGASFSTGQRQLLAFARTVASKPKILILDEATANIDSETEAIVQRSLAKMRQGRTTIAIAHRLSTIQDANCIYVLDKGKIIEHGRHEELLNQKGTYYKMYQLQAGML